MIYRPLGRTGLTVSAVCFGALTIGPLHRNLPLAEGVAVIREALARGVNFIDTAESYDTYRYIREAIRGREDQVVITSKSYGWNRELMEHAFEEARRELDRDVLDIFLMHEQESALTIAGHHEAWEFLQEQKAKGRLRAAGISCHAVAAVRAATAMPELDVIHPLINIRGHGIVDGSRDDMLAAMGDAAQAGKGLYGMKALAGGKLGLEARDCLHWAFARPELSSFAVGMRSLEEVRINLAWALGQEPDPADLANYRAEQRHIAVGETCVACGQCLRRCGQGAISLAEGAPRAYIEETRCVLCGYCRDNCEHQAIHIT